MRRALIGLWVVAMVAAACTAGGGTKPPQTVNPSGSNAPVKLSVWGFYTERELKNFTDILAGFQQKYPWITVDMVPGKEFQDIVRGINSGTPIDVAIDAGPDNVAKYCSSGGWIDLNPYIEADGLDMSATFPAAVMTYTNYEGKQCALPLLSDAYGLYYNKELLTKAGYTDPPKTLSELTAMAEKLTQFNADGSIKVAGFVPLSTFYEGYNIYLGNAWGAKWYDEAGKSAFATDPAWAQAFQWDKELTDFYGYDNLLKFSSSLGGANSEWSAANGFEAGRIAMLYDGEWREAFIQNDGVKLDYATAPFAVADDRPELYGSGLIGGTVVGVPTTSENPGAAWLLVKYLTTDTQALESLAHVLKNVPTTIESLKDPQLTSDPIFSTFLGIFSNPNSSFKPLTPIGTADADLESDFLSRWEAGKISDLQAGLQQLATQIDQQLQLG